MTENKTVDEKPHTQPETALEHYWFNLGHNSNKIAEENSYLNKKLFEAENKITALEQALAVTEGALEFYAKRDSIMPIEISPAKEALEKINDIKKGKQ